MRWILLVVFSLVSACTYAPVTKGLTITNARGLAEPKIQYLGVGGWLIHWKGEGVLLAPSFSNPAGLGITGVPPLFVKADNQKIDYHMPSAADVTMLLVGHAHYDHLLDVPRVMEVHTPNANVYGSATVGHILRAARKEDGTRAISLKRIVTPKQKEIADHAPPGKLGTWFYSKGAIYEDGTVPNNPPTGLIRAMPLESMHAGHVLGVNVIPGQYDHDLEEVPTYIRDWRLGEVTLAWVIDLLGDDGKPVYRIHYQDSSATPPWGLPPLIADSKPFDVVILCAGNWDQVSNYPSGLLRVIRPRLVVLGHWENFFGNDLRLPARTIPFLKYGGLMEQLRPYNLVVPEPFSEVQLPAPL